MMRRRRMMILVVVLVVVVVVIDEQRSSLSGMIVDKWPNAWWTCEALHHWSTKTDPTTGLTMHCSVAWQVPADYTPTTAYATYAEAYGTSNETGACTDKWPTGFVYKDEGNCLMALHWLCPILAWGEESIPKASSWCVHWGQLLDTLGTVGCWKCAPPRYVPRFSMSMSRIFMAHSKEGSEQSFHSWGITIRDA